MRRSSIVSGLVTLAAWMVAACPAVAQVPDIRVSELTLPLSVMSTRDSLELASVVPVDRQNSGRAAQPHDPWAERPVCASMFLKADWQLTTRQRACNWVQNGVLSTGRVFTTLTSTVFSTAMNRSSERGDGFQARFGRKWVQGAIATTGEYLGGWIAREDPREIPPYLVLRPAAPPRGFLPRLGSALKRTALTTECVEPCRTAKDIHKRPALSRVLGALGSGAAGVALNWDEPHRSARLWHGVLTSYVAAVGHQVISEFKPEAAKLGGRLFRMFGGS